MSTANDIVKRAYSKLSLPGQGQSLTAEEADYGINALNEMMHGWKADGVDLSHTDLVLTDTFTLASEYENGTICLLAIKIAAEIGRQVPAQVVLDADNGWRGILAGNLTVTSAASESGLKRMPSQYWPTGNVRW